MGNRGATEPVKALQVEEEKKQWQTQMLNKPIVVREVARAIRKLKKHKSPGEDLIPNEVWMVMEGEGMEELRTVLEECRPTNSFPEGWVSQR